jgi:hypothetical protein
VDDDVVLEEAVYEWRELTADGGFTLR